MRIASPSTQKPSGEIRKACHASVFKRSLLLAGAWALSSFAAQSAASCLAGDMETSFAKPPAECRPWIWWHWMNGNVSEAGIKADVKAMSDAGIGCAQIFDIGMELPEGGVDFMSPEWIARFRLALEEADKSGMKLGVNCSAGWANSGGPWMTLDKSMKKLVASKTLIQGPSKFSGPLPPRGFKLGPGNDYYKDLAVFAIAADDLRLKAGKVEASSPCDSAKLQEGAEGKESALSMPQGKTTEAVFDFGGEVEPRTLFLRFSQVAVYVDGDISCSVDGKDFKPLRKFSYSNRWMPQYVYNLQLDGDGSAPKARYFKVSMTPKILRGLPAMKSTGVAELCFSTQSSLEDAAGKSGGDVREYDFAQRAGLKNTPDGRRVIDLGSKVDAAGKLEWEVPAGAWTLLRVGFVSNGCGPHPTRASSRGLECDRLSPEAMDFHWKHMIDPLLRAAKGTKAFTNTLIDSYEMTGQNWGPEIVERFKATRGYDPMPFMPDVFAFAIPSKEEAERFLYDWRTNISEMMTDRYYGRFAEICEKDDLLSFAETYPGPYEWVAAGRAVKVPMGEFWTGRYNLAETPYCRVASSTAHLYGRGQAAAEAFTFSDTDGDEAKSSAWTESPARFKGSGDIQFCSGINKFVLHSYVHQPFLDPKSRPGFTLDIFSSHFGRNQTWWPFAKAWTDYMARCQFLLRQGVAKADVCVFSGENAPNAVFSGAPYKELVNVKAAGYDYDVCDRYSIVERFKVENGLLSLPGGANYKILSIRDSSLMSVEVLRAIEKLLRDGATIHASKPVRTPGLSGYPEAEKTLAAIADGLWGGNPAPKGSARVGKGLLLWGEDIPATLATAGVKPDFDAGKIGGLGWAHRSTGEREIYFVCNTHPDNEVSFDARFRLSGVEAALWNPVDGTMEKAPLWSLDGAFVKLPLSLPPSGSLFVVFAKTKSPAPHAVALSFKATQESAKKGLAIRKAFYGNKDASKGKDVTELLANRVKDGALSIGVDNASLGGDPLPNMAKFLAVAYTIDGVERSKTLSEFSKLSLKASNASPSSASSNESCRLQVSKGKTFLEFSANGTAKLALADGGSVERKCDTVKKPFNIEGKWKVSFPKDPGAPESVELDSLKSLSESEIAGVRFFAGIACYEKSFALDASMADALKGVTTLSLGELGEGAMAKAELNGKELGIVWTKPYAFDVSGMLKTGVNILKIEVSTPWRNRLIGDAALPQDCKYSGKRLAALPEWLVKGTPRAGGRTSLTTCDILKESSPLAKSGLLGPVELRFSTRIPVELQ